jgi:site-specific recombinase XerD
MNKDFSFYITKFFSDYLPNHRNASKNTIALYRDCFILFLQFCNKEKNINIDTISFKDISRDLILEFLSWLENERKSSIQTRNQRLATWKSFCKYVQFEDPQYFELCSNIRDIETKKYNKKLLEYLSVEAIKILLSQPNTSIKQEFRDLAILSLLYDSAARVQELIDLKVSNLTLDGNSKVVITGKGNKTRIVPLNKEVSKILKQYIKKFELKDTDILFTNKYGQSFTRKGICYILNKYIERAKINNSQYFRENISPHGMRHSKAMHLLENGVNLIYIRDFLGHVEISTTEIYAVANPEIRRKQIEAASKDVIKSKKYSEKYKNELLKYLKEEL